MEAKHKTFCCLVGLWSFADAFTCLPSVLDVLKRSLSFQFALNQRPDVKAFDL